MNVLDYSPGLRTQSHARSTRRVVTIGLVNNMGDEALKITERQFVELITMCAGDIDVKIRLFALKRTPRSRRALDYISARYDPTAATIEGGLDALIITGAQPRKAHLSEEPYWEELIDLIDWAKEHTASTILSCLAAHSAVLHLDGLERQPLPEKCTGVFIFTTQRDHPFAAWQKPVGLIPHSRYNGLSQSDLERAGYAVLTSSRAHGVDSFTKCFGSQFIFLQGHPEYDANSLAREYRRDVGRFLRRETNERPPRPKGYFDAEAEAVLGALELSAREEPASLPTAALSMIDALAPTEVPWRDAAISFYRNWINMIAASTHSKCPAADGLPQRGSA